MCRKKRSQDEEMRWSDYIHVASRTNAPHLIDPKERKCVSPRLPSYQKVDGLLATKVLLYLFIGTRWTRWGRGNLIFESCCHKEENVSDHGTWATR